MRRSKLIVGLGNPGKEYEQTRHNMGVMVVQKLAEKHNTSFSKEKKVLGELARHREENILFLVPTTYMNNSGEAVRKCLDYFKIEVRDLLVIADDIAIPFGTFRYREKGSCGGHNGLFSIEESLGSREYSRLRIGVGDRERGDLADHVLSRFTAEEREKLSGIIDEGVCRANEWIKLGEE